MSHLPKPTTPTSLQPRGLALEAAEPRLMFAADALAANGLAAADTSLVCTDVDPLELPVAAAVTSAVDLASASVATNTYGYTGAGQTVVIIDSGIAWDHTALGGGIGSDHHIVGGWDFAENDADPYDDGPMGTHGTHVAGIIGSLDPRYPGLAPGADIVALRVFDDQGQGDFPRIEAALRWVHDNLHAFANPITTVNLSLGARWNAEGAPEWSIIEDELAQLEADGLFIAVAAGNSFARHEQQVGLAYPAASSHVVPVASVDADGSLSSFSQRSDRVIAAPGRNVMSTVPDYAGNFNYRADDFLTLTGTSMAAPHVAAASMLVREAFAAAGRARVTQDDIYAVLRDTADVVFDTITGQDYRRLNLDRALASIVVVVPQPAPPPETPPPEAPPSQTPPAATPTPVPTNPPPSTTPAPSAVDWGRVDSALFADQALSGQAARNVTATHDGILTVEFVGATGGSARLYDGRGTLVAAASPTSGNLRLDATVIAGQSYRIAVDSVGASVDVRVTNLVRQDGLALYVFGTQNDDTFAFTAAAPFAGTPHEVIANGTRYTFDATTVRRAYLLGGDGNDTVTLVGTNNVDAAALRPGKISLRTTTVLALARGFETATIDGRGGRDTAYFADSQANETFTSWDDRAELFGGSSRLTVSGFESVRARSFGGNDTATLHVDAATDRVSQVGSSTMLLGANVLRELSGFQAISTLAVSPVALANLAEPVSSLSVNASATDRALPPSPTSQDVFASFARRETASATSQRSQTRFDFDTAAAAALVARGIPVKPPVDGETVAQLVGETAGAIERADVVWNRLCANAPAGETVRDFDRLDAAGVDAALP